MSNLTKNIMWAVITLIVISLLFSYFVGPQKQPTNLNLSQLVTDINAGQVKQIKVVADELNITMTDGSAATSQKEDGVGITDTLKNLGVNEQALKLWTLGVFAGSVVDVLLNDDPVLFRAHGAEVY